VLTLLTLAVMAAIVGASAAYHLGPLGHTARFGAANQMFKFDGAEPDVVDATGGAESWGRGHVASRGRSG